MTLTFPPASTIRYMKKFLDDNCDDEKKSWRRKDFFLNKLKKKDIIPLSSIMSFPIDSTLCVRPTDGETQFEAFQAVFAGIMNVESNCYKRMCVLNDIHLKTFAGEPHVAIKAILRDNTIPDGAKCIICKYSDCTHYIAYIKGSGILNPYCYYQPYNTQGFCQTFAFYLAVQYGGTNQNIVLPDLESLDPVDSLTKQEFNQYVTNSTLCANAVIDLIMNNRELLELLKIDFDIEKLDKKHDVTPGSTVGEFLDEFKTISTFDHVKLYVYDNPFRGKSTAKSFEKYITNNKANTVPHAARGVKKRRKSAL